MYVCFVYCFCSVCLWRVVGNDLATFPARCKRPHFLNIESVSGQLHRGKSNRRNFTSGRWANQMEWGFVPSAFTRLNSGDLYDGEFTGFRTRQRDESDSYEVPMSMTTEKSSTSDGTSHDSMLRICAKTGRNTSRPSCSSATFSLFHLCLIGIFSRTQPDCKKAAYKHARHRHNGAFRIRTSGLSNPNV